MVFGVFFNERRNGWLTFGLLGTSLYERRCKTTLHSTPSRKTRLAKKMSLLGTRKCVMSIFIHHRALGLEPGTLCVNKASDSLMNLKCMKGGGPNQWICESKLIHLIVLHGIPTTAQNQKMSFILSCVYNRDRGKGIKN